MSKSLPPFQAFLDGHRVEVFRFLASMVGPDEADDCFQETFIAALAAYPRLRPGSNARAWILTIARHKAIDAVRARERRAVPDEGAATTAVAGTAAPAEDPELWQAVGALPPKQRAALYLRYVADMPHRDVAQVLECSEDAARRSAHEGITKLREVWA